MSYDAARATAARLIGAKGRPITVLPPQPGPADPNAPWDGAADQVIATPNAIGVFLDFRKDGGMFSPGTAGLKAGTIEASDKRLLVAAQDATVVPNTSCRIVDTDGRRYKVVAILKQLEPGDAVILWELQVRA